MTKKTKISDFVWIAIELIIITLTSMKFFDYFFTIAVLIFAGLVIQMIDG